MMRELLDALFHGFAMAGAYSREAIYEYGTANLVADVEALSNGERDSFVHERSSNSVNQQERKLYKPRVLE